MEPASRWNLLQDGTCFRCLEWKQQTPHYMISVYDEQYFKLCNKMSFRIVYLEFMCSESKIHFHCFLKYCRSSESRAAAAVMVKVVPLDLQSPKSLGVVAYRRFPVQSV